MPTLVSRRCARMPSGMPTSVKAMQAKENETLEFITTSTGVAVISVGADNRYGHPAAATVARLRAHSVRVDRTDQEGTVETTLARTAVTVTTST